MPIFMSSYLPDWALLYTLLHMIAIMSRASAPPPTRERIPLRQTEKHSFLLEKYVKQHNAPLLTLLRLR